MAHGIHGLNSLGRLELRNEVCCYWLSSSMQITQSYSHPQQDPKCCGRTGELMSLKEHECSRRCWK